MHETKAHIVDPGRSLKALLGKVVYEAVHLALIDSAIPDRVAEDGQTGFWTEEELAAFRHDIYAIPEDAIARMDPGALARNVALRLLGPGGWMIGEVYAGNATAREVFEVSFERPDHSHVDEMAFDVMRAMEAAHELHYEEPDDDDDD